MLIMVFNGREKTSSHSHKRAATEDPTPMINVIMIHSFIFFFVILPNDDGYGSIHYQSSTNVR